MVQWKAPKFHMNGFTKLPCDDTGEKRNFEMSSIYVELKCNLWSKAVMDRGIFLLLGRGSRSIFGRSFDSQYNKKGRES